MKIRILPLVAISVIASVQAASITEKSHTFGNGKNASDSRALLKDNTHSEMDGASSGLSARAAYLALDADLNIVYKELRSLLAPANQKKLKDWQMKWVHKNENAAKNTSDPDEEARFLLEATKTRLAELEELLSEINVNADRELDFEENGKARHLNANGLTKLLTRDFPQDSLRLTLGITIPPGIAYSVRVIRDMWPELRYLSLDTSKKRLVCTFSAPDEGNATEGRQTWHDGYYISPNGAIAIVEVMDDAAFYSDGVEGQTCYYVYRLPALADVLRNAPNASNPKKLNLKPFRSLTRAELTEAYPDTQPNAAPANQEVTSARKEPHTKIATTDDAASSNTKVHKKDKKSSEFEELQQSMKAENIKISSEFKKIKNEFNRIISQPKTVKSTAKLQEMANHLDKQCDQLFSQIISKKEELFKKADSFPSLSQEVKVQFSKLDSLYSQMEEFSIIIKEDYLAPADGSSEGE